MATPMLFMAAEQSTKQEPRKPFVRSYEEPKPESTKTTAKGGGAKKSGKTSNTTKKQPQRGLGVAQLERLRLQNDRWKKITEMPQPRPQVLNLSGHPNTQHQDPTLTLLDPLSSVPLHYGASSYNGPVLINGPVGFYDLVGQSPRVANGTGSGFGFAYVGGNKWVHPSPYGTGAPDPMFQVGTAYETSKELTSMPKMQSLPSDCCDLCFKKKKFQSGNYKGGVVRRAAAADYSGNTNILIDDRVDGVEVRAVHRKGRSGGGGVLMEYEFFPESSGGKNDEKMRGGDIHEMMLQRGQAEASSSVSMGSHEEAAESDVAAASCCYGYALDLSLKLSF